MPSKEADNRSKKAAVIQLFHWLTQLLFLILFIGLPTSKAFASIGVAGLLVTSIVLIRLEGFPKWQKTKWFGFSPWLLLLLLMVSFFLSSDWSTAWRVLYKQNTLLVLPLALWVHQKLLRDYLPFYIKTFIASISFCSALTLLFFFLPESTTISLVPKLPFLQDYVEHEKQYAFGAYSPFIDRLHFSYLLGTAILLQLYLFFQDRENRIWKVFFLVLNLISFLLLGGRGAQFGFLGSAAIWMIFIYWKYVQDSVQAAFGRLISIGLLVVGLGIGVIVLPYLIYQNVPAVQARYNQLRWEIGTYQDNTFTNYPYEHFTSLRRIMSWKYNLEIIKDEPVFGTDIGDYKANLQTRYDRDALQIPINSHQQFLYYWAAAGISSFLVFTFIFIGFLYQAFQKKSWLNKALLISFWLFYLLVFMFDSPLIYQTGGLAFWIFLLVFLKEDF